MKKLLLSTFAFFLSTFAFPQQYGWVDLYGNMPDTPTDTVFIDDEPYYASYLDLFFINDQEGWVTSTQQNENQEFLIFHTQDGGQSWEIQTHWNYCHTIWMLDAENGYIGDQDGFIMVTHNGGETWDYHGATGGPVTDISFAPGSDTGYVTVDESYNLWQITPSGVNQIYIDHLNYWSGISVTEEDVWFCGGIQVWRWNLLQQELISEIVLHCGYFWPIFFVDNNHGWVGNLCNIRGFVDYDTYWPEILSPGEDQFLSLYATDINNLWATTMDGNIYRTQNASDYGFIPDSNYYWSNVEWEIQEHPKAGNFLGAIQFPSGNCGYTCGENNTILKYTLLSSTENKLEGQNYKIYPNPTKEKFKVQSLMFKVQDVEIKIFDLNGRKLLEKNIPAGKETTEVDVSRLENGMYLVQLQLENQTVSKKIIIQK